MKKVLLVDTNYSSAPILDYLIAADFDVFVCGANPNDFWQKWQQRITSILIIPIWMQCVP
ncbi:MAG: hypothetical protein IPN06_12750 [Burkholderiales bacterium]|nr:hypothetical protein [Burkholderiales bacterium]